MGERTCVHVLLYQENKMSNYIPAACSLDGDKDKEFQRIRKELIEKHGEELVSWRSYPLNLSPY